MILTLEINGRTHNVDVDLETPLLWVLRDTLSLVGTKYGCGGGYCGACTVLLDGTSRRSCTLPVGKIGTQRIVTIEGLSPDGSHPLQRAWVALDVPQCGYCQAGQIMSAAALLARTPHPTDDEITTALNGNLCRCGTYKRLLAAVRHAAGPTAASRSGSDQ